MATLSARRASHPPLTMSMCLRTVLSCVIVAPARNRASTTAR
jgi:hypothetical protein